jgi:hypothetical protein
MSYVMVMHNSHEDHMTIANISEEDWGNVLKQMRTLVDVYCELNEDTFEIKELLKKIVKVLRSDKRKSTKRKSTCKR